MASSSPSSLAPLLDRARAHATTYLETIRDRPVKATLDGPALRARLGGAWPDQGAPAADVIDLLGQAGATGTVATQGPRYFGFVVGGSFPVATAADWLVSAWDQNAGTYVLSPVVSVLEEVVSGWLKEVVGLAPSWSTAFVTGCQMANFTSLATARHSVLEQAGWNVERDGLYGAPPIDVFVSDESHYTIFTSLRMLGLGADRLRRVPTDGQGRMRAEALAPMLAGGKGPCIICTQAGNVNTGAFDPIEAVVPLARARGAWLHVDGAFGLWAAASATFRHLVRGVTEADSIATDGHKWLNVPYDCGVAFTAHRDAHRSTFLLPAHYVVGSDTERDPRDFTPDESRRGRIVPVYAVLRTLGRSGLAELVERPCHLATRMAERLARHTDVAILNDVVLNQVLVRFHTADRDVAASDALTRRVIARVQDEGTCWLSGTTWQGIVAMRVSISNWSTTEADIDRSASAILAALQS